MSTPAARRFEALEQRVDVLERELALLRTSRTGRDRWSVDLRHAVAASTGGRPFRLRDLLQHAAVDPSLQAALEDAMLTSADAVGSWLRDGKGTHEGVTIERLRRRYWRAYTSDTYVLGG